MKTWFPIETAPRVTGIFVVGFRENWDMPAILVWKFNPRTGDSYFGDPCEMDDYENISRGATHWCPIPADHAAANMSGHWRSALLDAPGRGEYVEIGRIRGEDIVGLDKLWWYPQNWNLNGMYWRPAQKRLDKPPE